MNFIQFEPDTFSVTGSFTGGYTAILSRSKTRISSIATPSSVTPPSLDITNRKRTVPRFCGNSKLATCHLLLDTRQLLADALSYQLVPLPLLPNFCQLTPSVLYSTQV